MCQSPHLWWKKDCIHGRLLWCTTKNFHHVCNRSQFIFILDWDRLRRRTNLQIFLNAVPCNHKFLVSHPAFYMISVHNSIGEKLVDNLWIHNPNRVQQLGPSSFFEYLRYESTLKWFQLHYPFHNDCFVLIVIIVFHIWFCWPKLSESVCARLDDGFLVAACLVGAICITIEPEKNQVQYHKNRSQKKKKMIRYMLDQTEMKTSQNRAYHTQNKVNKHNHHAKSVRVGNHNHNAWIK